jgi:hypothetical protein
MTVNGDIRDASLTVCAMGGALLMGSSFLHSTANAMVPFALSFEVRP